MGTIKENPKFMKSKVRTWMRIHLEEYRDGRTGEINLTTMCEDAATEFGMNEEGGPLDDDTHWIWDVSVEVTPERASAYGSRS